MLHRSALFAAVSAASLLAGAALAAEPPSSVEELVITGSRTEGRTRLETLAPVDVISTEALTRQGNTEMATALAAVAPSMSFPRTAPTVSARPPCAASPPTRPWS